MTRRAGRGRRPDNAESSFDISRRGRCTLNIFYKDRQ